MSFATLERAVLAELKVVAKNSKIRLKDIMEWSTGEIKPQEGETYYFLPDLNVHCCVKLPAKKAAEHHAHLTPESLASSQAVVNASASEPSDGDSSPAQAQVA